MVTRESVEHVAKLAQLTLSEAEVGSLTTDLNEILNYVDELKQVDVTNVAPLENLNEDVELNVLRPDSSRPSLPVTEALKNAPRSGDGYFLVPKVLKQEVKSYVEQDIAGDEEEELL